MKAKQYVVTKVECPRCKTEQKIHIAPNGAQKSGDKIPCIQCDNRFKPSVPERIVDGPFPA